MIQEIRLSNFKAFADTVTIPIKPITLIFGPNSSGKSSFLHALLMLKQTIEESVSDKQTLLPKGSRVDLGNYREFIHNHEESRSFSVTFKVAPSIDLYDAIPAEQRLLDTGDSGRLNGLEQSIKSLPLGITIEFSSSISGEIHVTKIDLLGGDDPTPIITFVNEQPENMESLGNEADKEIKNRREEQWRIYRKSPKNYLRFKKFENHDYWKKYFEAIKEDEWWANWKEEFESFEIVDHLKKSAMSKSFLQQIESLRPDQKDTISSIDAMTDVRERLFRDDFLILSKFLPVELNGYDPQYLLNDNFDFAEHDNISVLILAVSFLVKRFLSNCVHIGPVRQKPERNKYFLVGTNDPYVGVNGQYANDIIGAIPETVEKINEQLANFNIHYQIKPVTFTSDLSNLKVFTMRLIDESGIDLEMTDVGYGISQVLPIMLQCILSKGETIFVEQPELHLHPSQQAELGDLFINAALAEQKNTFIIETHSEHLILRLLRRIRETTEGTLPQGYTPITPDQISVLYVEPGKDGSKIISLGVTEDGDFINQWPHGFFTDREKELF